MDKSEELRSSIKEISVVDGACAGKRKKRNKRAERKKQGGVVVKSTEAKKTYSFVFL